MLKPLARGLTLIELMVGLVILAMLLALGTPAFTTWMANARIRSTAEATLAGLQLTRSEASNRNAFVRFQLTTSLESDCELSTTGPNWVVDIATTDADDSVASRCNLPADDTSPPHLLHKRAAAGALGSTLVTSTVNSLVFNGLGRLRNGPANGARIDITGPDPANCRPLGELNCLRLEISAAGQVRLCNPVFSSGTAQACLMPI